MSEHQGSRINRKWVVNQELFSRIYGSSQLPTLPAIAVKVLELTQNEDVGVQEIASVIMKDPALTSKILKTVNSPFYGLPKQVSTLSSALVILGLQAVKTLALGFSLVNSLRQKNAADSGEFDHGLFWKRSIYAAVGSRILAQKRAVVQQEEAFLAGLLANMGSLVLHRVIPEQFDRLYAGAGGDNDKLIESCRAELQTDPPEVSAAMAEKWQFPPLLVKPIALHHSGGSGESPQIKPLIDVVSMGVMLAEVFASKDTAGAIAKGRKALAERFGMEPGQIEEVLAEIGKTAREAASLLEMSIGAHRTYQQILDEAQEALVAVSLQSQHQVQTIRREVQNLQIRASSDPLTGLANRLRFDEFLEEHFKRAYQHLRPLSLLFLDLDFFKNINDTHGHQVGDEVLRQVGRLLRNSVRNIDLVARYGGEEFAIVLTEADTAAAAARAETIRDTLCRQPMELRDGAVTVTVSVGVAGTDRTRCFGQKEELVKAADRALYAAKDAGRNTVRVFRPRQTEKAGAGA